MRHQFLFLLLGLLAFAPGAQAQPYSGKPNTEDLKVQPLENLGSVDPALIAGRKANPADFPANFYGRFGNSRCTATLVGPQAVLTAAHCVGNGKQIEITIAAAVFQGKCTHHGQYKNDGSADYALCQMNEIIPNRTPEKISLADEIKVDRRVLLSGYGCVRHDMAGGNDGIYRIGRSRIRDLMGKVSFTENGKNVPYPHYFTTVAAVDAPAIICPGDSGGPVYCMSDDDDKSVKPRVVCGVNSAVECTHWVGSDCTMAGTISYLSALSTQAKWLKEQTIAKLCGVHPEISQSCP
jgi:hypothetical protein